MSYHVPERQIGPAFALRLLTRAALYGLTGTCVWFAAPGLALAQLPADSTRNPGVPAAPERPRARAHGVEGPAAMAGLRARLTLRIPDTLTWRRSAIDGFVLRATEDSVVVECREPTRCATGAGTTALAWDEVTALEVRRARAATPRETVQHAAWGVVAGTLFGGAAGAVGVLALTSVEGDGGPAWRAVPAGAAVGAALGGAAGGIMAVIWSRGVWVRVPLPQR